MALVDIRHDIAVTRKKWYVKTKDKDPFADKTDAFINFLKKSGERDCECLDATPLFKIEQYPDGQKHGKVSCSKCKGKFYKTADFSFVWLILGRKGGGKTTTVMMYADLIHTIDPNRKIKMWQCPPNLISVLHNLNICGYYKTVCERAMGKMKWSAATPAYKNPDEPIQKDKDGKVIPPRYQKNEELHRVCKFTEYCTPENCKRCPHFQQGKQYFQRVSRLEELEWNDIVIVDEGIISVNAKLALSKKMRMWDQFLAVVRHFRICLFVLFQRFEVIKALREMSDMILYKSLPSKLIEDESKDQIIKKYGQNIMAFKKWEGMLASSHQDFDCIGMLKNKVPEWYTDEVSMSYVGDMSFISQKEASQEEIDRAKIMAQWLIDQNYPPITKPDQIKGAKFKIREYFNVKMDPTPTSKELTMAIEAYYAMTIYDGITTQNSEEFKNTVIKDDENVKFFDDIKKGGISEKEMSIFDEFCKGKSVTEFSEPPYSEPKQRVTEIVRRVGAYYTQLLKNKSSRVGNAKDGEESERAAVKGAWAEKGYGLRSVGSGGDRGNIPSPDVLIITPEGKVRPVQVKERTDTARTFSPLTFNTELKIANRIRTIAKNTRVKCNTCGEYISNVLLPDNAYLYFYEHGTSNLIKDPISIEDNKMTLRVDWENKRVIRQPVDMGKVKNPRTKEFLESEEKIYWGAEQIEDEKTTEMPPVIDEKEQEEIINFDKLLKEIGIEE